MHLGEICGSLVGTREGAEFRILIQIAEEGNADGCAGTTDVIFVAGIDGGRFGRVVLANAVGLDDGGMAGEIGDGELVAIAGHDDDVDNFKNGCHLPDGDGAGPVGLDVFDSGIKARGAKHVGPVFRTLRGEQFVATASW